MTRVYTHTHTQPKHPITTCPTSISLRRSDNTIRHESFKKKSESAESKKRSKRSRYLAPSIPCFNVEFNARNYGFLNSNSNFGNPSLHQVAIVSLQKASEIKGGQIKGIYFAREFSVSESTVTIPSYRYSTKSLIEEK